MKTFKEIYEKANLKKSSKLAESKNERQQAFSDVENAISKYLEVILNEVKNADDDPDGRRGLGRFKNAAQIFEGKLQDLMYETVDIMTKETWDN